MLTTTFINRYAASTLALFFALYSVAHYVYSQHWLATGIAVLALIGIAWHTYRGLDITVQAICFSLAVWFYNLYTGSSWAGVDIAVFAFFLLTYQPRRR